MRSALKWHRRFLQVLQWQCPGVRWALKSPQHMWHLAHIHREYPDALFVQTHRDPVNTVISMSNLAAALQGLASDHADQRRIAAHYAEGLAKGYNNTVHYRKTGALPDSQVVDLYFRDFMADQVGTVRRAYAHFGLELPGAAAAAMQSFLDDNPADKHGKHLYSFEDTGLDEDWLRGLFSEYETYFNVPRESLRTKGPQSREKGESP